MRTVHLVSDRQASFQRAHFSLFVPSATDPTKGTVIRVVGAPMAGYALEFKRNHSPASIPHSHKICPIGQVASAHIVDSTDPAAAASIDCQPKGDIEIAAAQVPPPGLSRNFLAPVDDVCIYARVSGHVRVELMSDIRQPTNDARNGRWSMFGTW